MGLFISQTSDARAPGAYAVDISAERPIDEASPGFIGYVGQFDWGPSNEVYQPVDTNDFLRTYAPAGSGRTSTGYLGVLGRKGFTCKVVRVLHGSPVKASAAITGTGGTQTVTAKYFGTLGNSITVTYAAAASGNAALRDITVTLSNAYGSTVEVFRDCALPASNVAGSIDVSASALLGSIAIASNVTPAWPANGTTTLASGANGTSIVSGDYVGTQGAADLGLALFETHDDIRVVTVDDCGSSLRAAVAAGVAAHCAYMGDRVGYAQIAETTDAWSAVKTAWVSALKTNRFVSVGNYVTVYDAQGTLRTTPFATMLATARLNLKPQESHAWRHPKALDYYGNVVGIVGGFSSAAPLVQSEATDTAFICLAIKTRRARFAALHDRSGAGTFIISRVIEDFLALSMMPALEPYVNGPNLVEENNDVRGLVNVFLEAEVRDGKLVKGPNNEPAFSTDISMNTATTMGQGVFTLALDGRSPAPREKIFVLFNVGPTVTVRKTQDATA